MPARTVARRAARRVARLAAVSLSLLAAGAPLGAPLGAQEAITMSSWGLHHSGSATETIGWQFTATGDGEISALGWFKHGTNSFFCRAFTAECAADRASDVGLWEATIDPTTGAVTGGTLLASATVQWGDGTTFAGPSMGFGRFFYAPLAAPVALVQGTTYILGSAPTVGSTPLTEYTGQYLCTYLAGTTDCEDPEPTTLPATTFASILEYVRGVEARSGSFAMPDTPTRHKFDFVGGGYDGFFSAGACLDASLASCTDAAYVDPGTAAVVPEPATVGLTATGLLAMLVAARRRVPR